MLPGPCHPIPMTPRLMRLLGEVVGVCAAAALRRTAGRMAADPAVFRNRRRLKGRKRCSYPDSCGITCPNFTLKWTKVIYIIFTLEDSTSSVCFREAYPRKSTTPTCL